jgi:hypothetical protein
MSIPQALLRDEILRKEAYAKGVRHTVWGIGLAPKLFCSPIFTIGEHTPYTLYLVPLHVRRSDEG